MNEKRHLLIVDRIPSALPRKQVGVAWDILGLGRTPDELVHGLSSLIRNRNDIRILDPIRWADKAAAQVREFVIPLINGLPERKFGDGHALGSLLEQPNGLNDWWFLEIAEKSPFRGSLINELYYLVLIRKATQEVAYSSVRWLACNQELRSAVAGGLSPKTILANSVSLAIPSHWLEWIYYIRAVRALVWNICLRVIARCVGLKDSWPSGNPAIFTVFPGWWVDVDSLQARDRFFSAQARAGENANTSGPNYWVWWSANPCKTWQFRKLWKTLIRKKNFSVLSRHIPLSAWQDLFSPTLFFRLRNFRKTIGQVIWPKFNGFDVSGLLQKEVSRSIGSGGITTGRLLPATIRACASRFVLPELWFRFEGQPIDRALLLGIRGITKSVGFWHSVFAQGPNYLPYLLEKESLKPGFYAGHSAPPPFPDVIMTSSSICQKNLLSKGFPPQRIRTRGPLRNSQVMKLVGKKKNQKLSRANKNKKCQKPILFLAGSVHFGENRGMIHALLRSLSSFPSMSVFIRPHPACPISHNLLYKLRIHSRNSIVSLVKDNEVFDQLSRADVLVSGGSSIAFEAMALGVMPLVYESPSEFSPCSMQKFKNAIFIVHNSEEITKCLKAVFGRTQQWSDRRKKWPQVCQAVFGDLWTEGKGAGLDGAGNPGPS